MAGKVVADLGIGNFAGSRTRHATRDRAHRRTCRPADPTSGGTYAQMVSFIGNTAHQGQVEADAQDKILSQAQQAQQSVSGVNLDEEAANLQRYQQAYQAAGKVLATAATLFDAILNIVNG